MQYRQIGALEVSVVGLGGNGFGTEMFGTGADQAETTRIVDAALEAGINLVDTAEEYSIRSFLGDNHSEEFLGVALRGRRDDVVIASKFQNHDEGDPTRRGAARIVAAVEGSLRRLDTDRIDLYQQHFPDPDTPLDEILTALDRLVRDGKVREIGCCNFDAAMLDAAADAAATRSLAPYRSNQVQYSVLEPAAPDLVAAMRRHGTPALAYFPLAHGLLTGKYRRGEAPPADARLGTGTMVSTMFRDGMMARRPPLSPARLTTVERLTGFAEDHGHTLLELAVSWLVAQPVVASVLTGVTRATQVVANAAAADWAMTPDEVTAIAAIVAAEGPPEG